MFFLNTAIFGIYLKSLGCKHGKKGGEVRKVWWGDFPFAVGSKDHDDKVGPKNHQL